MEAAGRERRESERKARRPSDGEFPVCLGWREGERQMKEEEEREKK